jgi:hypothetical protein
MQIVVLILLVLAAHFSLTPFAPAKSGKAAFYWPFASDTRPVIAFVGRLPNQSGGLITPVLAAVAGLCFAGAVLGILGIVVPASWWPILVVVAAVASILLYVLYFGVFALLPLAIDAVLLWGVLFQGWTANGLRGV